MPTKTDINLVFDFEAVTRLEEEHKINLLEGALKAEDLSKPDYIRKLVWAGLLHEQPDLKPDDVRVILKDARLSPKVLYKRIISAIKEAVGSDEKDPASDPADEAGGQS